MLKARSKLSFLFLAGLIILLGSAGRPALAQKSDPIRVVLPHRVLFDISLPYYVAQDRGLFEKAGLQVTSIFARGGGEQVQILVAGDADVAIGTGLLAAFSTIEKGGPVKIISAEATGVGDVFWYVKGDSPIKKIEDLAGKKVGFSNPGSSSHLVTLSLATVLGSKGLAAPELVPGGSFPEQFTAVMTGQIDAGWSAPPFFLDEVKKGNIRILFRGNDVPEVADLTIRVNLARAEFLKSRAETMRKYLAVTKSALDFIFSNPDEAAKIWVKNAQIKESPEAVKEAWKYYNSTALALSPIKGVERSVADAVKFKFLKKPFGPEELGKAIDLGYLPK